LAKILNFLYPFFLAKIGQEKVFGNVLDRKLVFLDFKNIASKKSRKIGIFPKGLVHGFVQNFENLFIPFFNVS